MSQGQNLLDLLNNGRWFKKFDLIVMTRDGRSLKRRRLISLCMLPFHHNFLSFAEWRKSKQFMWF